MIAYDALVREVLSDIAYDAGVSVVLPDVETVVSLDLAQVPAERAFREVAAAARLVPVLDDDVVTFREADGYVDSVTVERATHDDPSLLASAMTSIIGDQVTVQPVGDRFVLGGPSDGVRRARELLDVLRVGPDGWVLDVVLFQVSDRFQRDLGVGWDIGGAASVVGDVGVGNQAAELVPAFGARARVAVEAMFAASEAGAGALLVTHGTLFVLEGEDAAFQQGEVVRVPQRVVSDQGTVSTLAFSEVRTGFAVQVNARRVPDGVMLRLQPSISEVVGFGADGQPNTTEQTVDSTMVVSSGDWLLLSGLSTWRDSFTSTGTPAVPVSPLSASATSSKERTSLLVAVRAERVYSSGGRSDEQFHDATLPDDAGLSHGGPEKGDSVVSWSAR